MSREIATLLIESDQFNFDYSHFLPWHKGQCAKFHGHSSKISVAVTGYCDDKGMLVDFADLKSIIKETLVKYDHKIFVPEYTVLNEHDEMIEIAFVSARGKHRLDLPISEVFKIPKDSTVENLSRIIANDLLQAFPASVIRIEVKMYEGIGKSALVSCSNGHS